MLQKGFVNVPLMVFITLLVVTAGVFYMVGRGSVDTKVETFPQPSPTVSSTIDDTLKGSPSPVSNWETIDIDKVEGSWRAYSVTYPTNLWNASERYVEGAGTELILTKGNNKITITQGAGDGNGCLFGEEKQGQYSQYVNKKAKIQ